jgi:hypothetical protein
MAIVMRNAGVSSLEKSPETVKGYIYVCGRRC